MIKKLISFLKWVFMSREESIKELIKEIKRNGEGKK